MRKYYIYHGRLYFFEKVFFDEIMQVFYMDVMEYEIYNHYRRQGEDKYSVWRKMIRVTISMRTPQVENTLMKKTMNSVILEIERLWMQYLEYAIEGFNKSLIQIQKTYSNESYIDKATFKQLIDMFRISEKEWESIAIYSPYSG